MASSFSPSWVETAFLLYLLSESCFTTKALFPASVNLLTLLRSSVDLPANMGPRMSSTLPGARGELMATGGERGAAAFRAGCGRKLVRGAAAGRPPGPRDASAWARRPRPGARPRSLLAGRSRRSSRRRHGMPCASARSRLGPRPAGPRRT